MTTYRTHSKRTKEEIDALLHPRPVFDSFDKAVTLSPQHPFIEFLGKTLTYGDVNILVNHAATGLQKLGIQKGDRVGLLLPNTPHYIILYLAITKIGGTLVNFNPLYAEKEIMHQIKDSGVKIMATLDIPALFDKLEAARKGTNLHHIIFCSLDEVLPKHKAILRRLFKSSERAPCPRSTQHIHFQKLIKNDGKYHQPSIDPLHDVAVLQYTGGTTGLPKGAMLTHANLHANALQGRGIFPVFDMNKVRMMGILPLCHVFALTVVLNTTLAMAGTIILLPRFEVMELIRTIHKKKPTLFPSVPSIFTAINHTKSINKYNLSSIDYCISGGAPLPVEVKRAFEKITNCIIVEGYGLTESSAVASCNPIEGENREGTIGLPVIGTLIDIVSLEDGTTIMPDGERGEVCMRGPQVMKGYWQQQDESDLVLEKMPNGEVRLHTGDVGVRDEQGYITIVDRIKDMITMGGFKIYPRHVEEALYLHPAIEECVVAGIESKTRGQTVKAFIKLRQGETATAPEIKDFLKDKLAPHEIPKRIAFKDSLPKTVIGKLSRKLIVDEDKKSKQA